MAKAKFSLRKNPWASAAQWAKAEAEIAEQFPEQYARAVASDPNRYKIPFKKIAANGDTVTMAAGGVSAEVRGTAEAWAGCTPGEVLADVATFRPVDGQSVRKTNRAMQRRGDIRPRLRTHRLAGKRSAPPMAVVHGDTCCVRDTEGNPWPKCKGIGRERQGMPVLVAQARVRARG